MEATSLVGGTPNFTAATGRSGNGEPGHPNQITSSYDLRLTLDSSLTGRDLLRTRLRAGNTAALPFGSSAQILRLDTPSSTAGELIIDRLYVSVPISDIVQVNAGALVRNTGMLAFIPSAYNSRVLDFFQLAGASGTYNRAVGSGLGVQLSHQRKADGSTLNFDLNGVAQNGFADSETGVLTSASGINVLSQLGVQGPSWGARWPIASVRRSPGSGTPTSAPERWGLDSRATAWRSPPTGSRSATPGCRRSAPVTESMP